MRGRRRENKEKGGKIERGKREEREKAKRVKGGKRVGKVR